MKVAQTSDDIYVVGANSEGSYPVERKVWWSTLVGYGVMVLCLLVLELNGNPELVAALPDWAKVLLVPLLPAAAVFAGGYMAKHQARSGERGQVADYRSAA